MIYTHKENNVCSLRTRIPPNFNDTKFLVFPTSTINFVALRKDFKRIKDGIAMGNEPINENIFDFRTININQNPNDIATTVET